MTRKRVNMIYNQPLKSYNTFGLGYIARSFAKCDSEESMIDLLESIDRKNERLLILGGGSNILFTRDFNGLVIHPGMRGIDILDKTDKQVMIRCDAGVNWDSFVEYCVSNNYRGLENLSYIPGNVGASPIQNIGAYGAEVKDSIVVVRALDIRSGKIEEFGNQECQFGYRSSLFKNKYPGKYIITAVTFSLKRDLGELNLTYGNLRERFNPSQTPTLQMVRDTIIDIRKEKLPEPSVTGNAGSFFKNPEVDKIVFEKIHRDHKDLPSYDAGNNNFKIPAGWLIEKCGWKGYRRGDAGVHTNQALVLVNYGMASGSDILKLSEDIIESVFEKYGIKLEREVNII